MKTFLRVVLTVLLIASLLCTGAAAVTVEQVQLCMPQVDVYFYEDGQDLSGLTAADVTAELGGEPLRVTGLSRAEQGIYYVYMLDVSASMPDDYFSAAREAVKGALSRLREQDQLALISFGSDVRLLLRGGESREKAAAALDALDNTDADTKFYTAMNALAELVSATEDMRRIAVVISDGIDDTDAGMTQEELEQKLVQSGVSVNGLCLNASSADVEGFRKLVEMSGGEFSTFGPDDAVSALTGLLTRLEGGWHLALEASSNVASGQETPLHVDFGGRDSLDLTVTPVDYVPDDRAPRVESAKYDRGAGTVTVVFSEPVNGADDLSAYALTTDAGETLAVASASAAEDGASCVLTPAAPLPENGSVTLTVSGLTDVSMEKNEMYRYSAAIWSPQIAASAAPSPSAAPAGEEPLISRTTLIVLIAAAVLVAAAAVTIVALANRRSGDKKAAASREKEKKEKPEAVKSTATFMFLNGGDGKKEKRDPKDQ